MIRSFEEWKPEDYLRCFWTHKWKILLIASLFCVYKTAVMLQSPNFYKTKVRILIETEAPRILQFKDSGASRYDQTSLATEYQVIGSRAVIQNVIDRLHLAAFEPFSLAKDPVELLKRRINIRPVRGTKLVDISVVGKNPELIAKIANSIAGAYAETNQKRQLGLTSGGIEWLQAEVAKMKTKMHQAQLDLQNFKEEHGSVDFGPEKQAIIRRQLQGISAQLSDKKDDRIKAEATYRDKHPRLKELLQQERDLSSALYEKEQQALKMSRLSIQYKALLREAVTSEEIYDTLLTRLKELTVQEGLQTNNVQIVDEALVPDTPVGPGRKRKIMSSTAMGFFIGCILALLLEFFRKSIRTRDDFESILQMPFLGHLPLLSTSAAKRASKKPLILQDENESSAETLRSIRTTLEFILNPGESHALLITSSLPNEGKSLISINLATALQRMGKKVLLVDADLRRPSIHQLLNLELEPGLSEMLQNALSAKALIESPQTYEDLDIICAGITPTHPTDLLGKKVLEEAIAEWKKTYDYILIDSSPCLVAADSSVIATLVDGVLFIVRSGKTQGEAAFAARQRLIDVGARIVGGILNGARLDLEKGYRYYYTQNSK